MIAVPVVEESQAGEARRRAAALGRQIGMDGQARDRLALIVTEVATNLWRHACGGEVLIGPTEPGSPVGCHVIGIDGGPGIASVENALQDGYSTAGQGRGLGGGLGAIRRLSEAFDIHTDQRGTTVAATVAPGWKRAEGPVPAAGVVVPKPGYSEGGDGWALRHGPERSLVMLIDVLGHGSKAAAVAVGALAAFHAQSSLRIDVVEPAVSAALNDRGAALLLVEVPHGSGTLRALGIGNLRGTIIQGGERRGIVSVAGIAGQINRSKRILDYPWGPGASLILSTDGLRERPGEAEPPSLLFRSPLTVAGTLYRRRRRGTDDCGVVVVQAG